MAMEPFSSKILFFPDMNTVYKNTNQFVHNIGKEIDGMELVPVGETSHRVALMVKKNVEATFSDTDDWMTSIRSRDYRAAALYDIKRKLNIEIAVAPHSAKGTVFLNALAHIS